MYFGKSRRKWGSFQIGQESSDCIKPQVGSPNDMEEEPWGEIPGSHTVLVVEKVTLTLVAYFSELRFSAKSAAAGLRQVNMTVLALPPRESLRILVILLSRYGIWVSCN